MQQPGNNRRILLKGLGLEAAAAGLGVMGATAEGWAAPVFDSAVQSGYADKPMKIVKVESVRFSDKIEVGGGSGGSGRAEFCWVRLHTDTGIIGTGETYPGVNGELGALKDFAKRFLLGKDPRDIDGIWQNINQYMSMRNSGGADMHILSAINMAQLDILGQSTGLPLYRLLGGRTRAKVKVYNTTTDYCAINNMKMGPDTGKIVRFLLDRGVTGIKIYPFTDGKKRPEGRFISSADLDECLT